MWKVDGKIAVFGKTDKTKSVDAVQICFKNVNTADLQDIEKVYFIPANVCLALSSMTTTQQVSELAKWLVWYRHFEDSSRILIANSQDVAIEFTPSSDITLNSAAIFTDYTKLGTAAFIRVMNSAGVDIAFSNTCTVTLDTKYQLAGAKRETAFSTNPVLKAGETYYFAFNRGYGGTTDYYPARFQDETGNYRVFNELSNATPVDVSTWNKYIGRLSGPDGLSTFIGATENDYMSWKSSSSGDYIFSNNRAYVRSAVTYGTSYAGIIANGANERETVNSILNLLSDTSFYYTGYSQTHQGITQNKLYAKSDVLNTSDYVGILSKRHAGYGLDNGKYYVCPDNNGNGVYIYKVLNTCVLSNDCSSYLNFVSLTVGESAECKMHEQAPYFQYGKIYSRIEDAEKLAFTSNDEVTKTAELFATTYGHDDGSKKVIPMYTIWYSDQYYVLTRKSNTGISQIQDITPLTALPETPVDTGIYFFNSNVVSSGSSKGIWQYSASTSTYTQIIYSHDTFKNYFDSAHPVTLFEITDEDSIVEEKKLSDTLEGPYELSTLVSENVAGEATLLNAETLTDKKFYLEINGTEVL